MTHKRVFQHRRKVLSGLLVKRPHSRVPAALSSPTGLALVRTAGRASAARTWTRRRFYGDGLMAPVDGLVWCMDM